MSVSILKKHFVFDKLFNLFEYDLDMSRLYTDLKKLKKEAYPHNYRFIFLHYDTEYYVQGNTYGVTMLNLQRILAELDISNYFCLVLSQQQLAPSLKTLKKQETVDSVTVASLQYQNFYFTNQYFHRHDHTADINREAIVDHYFCANRQTRFHRRVFFSLLKSHNLLQQGSVSFLNLPSPVTESTKFQSNSFGDNEQHGLHLIECNPPTRLNERWFLHTELTKNSLSQLPLDTVFNNFNDTGTGLDPNLLKQSFLQVVIESAFDYPTNYITEKTIWPLLLKRPFVIVGPRYSLRNLQTLGFQTFASWWDESYDSLADPEQRMLAILEIVKEICSYSTQSLQDLCKDMEPVLNYNFDYYQTCFAARERKKLEKFCEENLLSRHD